MDDSGEWLLVPSDGAPEPVTVPELEPVLLSYVMRHRGALAATDLARLHQDAHLERLKTCTQPQESQD